MKILITGGTGFVGHHLVKKWQHQHDLTILGRDIDKIKRCYPTLKALSWPQLKQPEDIQSYDAIINLAGSNLGEKRWTKAQKEAILTSRTETTKHLAQLCSGLGELSPHLYNVSAVGIYGLQAHLSEPAEAFTEDTPVHWQSAPDFLSYVAGNWEQAAHLAEQAKVAVTYLRFGVVLSDNDGALPQIARPFYFGLGGTIGSGQQPFAWIHIDDLIEAIDFIVNKKITGPINCVAPENVKQKTLAQTLAKTLHRPALFKTPAFLLKLMLGEMADALLLHGQNVYPKRLLDAGFQFKYPQLAQALKNIYNQPSNS
jgi:uncharacterized protein (TIGR01777 family)